MNQLELEKIIKNNNCTIIVEPSNSKAENYLKDTLHLRRKMGRWVLFEGVGIRLSEYFRNLAKRNYDAISKYNQEKNKLTLRVIKHFTGLRDYSPSSKSIHW